LKQISSRDELVRLHDRYATQKYHRYLKADTAFNTLAMQDAPPFTLVRTVGELRNIARESRNCAEIYCQSCITGQYVHWLYRYSDESALLQMDCSHHGKPTVSQFFGPRNTAVSGRAMQHCARVSERGPCTHRHLWFPQEARVGKPGSRIRLRSGLLGPGLCD
jgi:hypothetical protein